MNFKIEKNGNDEYKISATKVTFEAVKFIGGLYALNEVLDFIQWLMTHVFGY